MRVYAEGTFQSGEALPPPPRAIIPFKTGDLRLVSYLRNADRAGWNFCLERQHGSATAVCANTSVDAIQKFLPFLLVAKVFNCVDFHYSVYILNGDLIRRIPSISFLLHFLKHEYFILSVLEITQFYMTTLF